jgi:predicted dehydrogenase
MVRGFIREPILDEWAEDPTGWKPSAHGTGAIMDCAPHLLYQLVWYFGEVEMLHAIAQHYAPDVELENHGIIAGRVAGGALFSVELSSVTEYPRGERVEIYGSEATLIIDQVLDPPMVLYRGDSDHYGTAIAEVPHDLTQWKSRSIAVEVADFVDAVCEGRPRRSTWRTPSTRCASSRPRTNRSPADWRSTSGGVRPRRGLISSNFAHSRR